ncbi:MAG: methyl-accepting chemotaxis protein [Lachnospiraceae bacterium]
MLIIDKISVLDESGSVLYSTNEDDENIYASVPAVAAVLNAEQEYAVSGVIDAGSGQETVMLAVAIPGETQSIKGVLVGNIRYEVFDRAMKECTVTGIQNLAAYIMDEEGVIFGHTEANKVGTAVKNSVIQDVVRRLGLGEQIEKGGTSYEYNGEQKFAGYYVMPENHWIICLSVSESEIISPIRQVEKRAYMISIVLCVIACVVTIGLTGMIVKPIRVTNGVLNQIADFHYQIDENYVDYAKKKDETGEMCSAICTVVDSLRDEMTQINSVSEELTATARSLQKIATSVATSSENTNDLMNEMTGSLDGIEHAASDIGQYISSVRKSADKMNCNAEDSMEKAQSLMERAAQIKEKAVHADQESEYMFQRVKAAMETAVQQAQSVEKIQMFTESILEIASRTKLLSLNASIEAANAGVNGRGFAVVADEIGKLAAQSAQSTDSIKSLVTEIYQAVHGLKQCLEQSLAYIEQQVVPDYRQFSAASEDYSQDAGEMIQSMDILKNEIQSFLCEMEKSVAAVEQINENIEDSVEKMHGMAKENESVGEQIQETYCMIQENSAHAKKLKTIVKKYNL